MRSAGPSMWKQVVPEREDLTPYGSTSERLRIEAEVAKGRRPGEDVVAHMERVLGEAGVTALPAAGLPYRDAEEREPGAEG
jgi:hypothetical protein